MRAQPLRNLLIVLTIFGALLAACSETSPPSGGSGGSGGQGGQGGGDSVALAAELCPGACDTAKTCYAPLDLDACKAQCAEELAGRGRRDALRSCFKLACYEMNNGLGDSQPEVEPMLLRDREPYVQ